MIAVVETTMTAWRAVPGMWLASQGCVGGSRYVPYVGHATDPAGDDGAEPEPVTAPIARSQLDSSPKEK